MTSNEPFQTQVFDGDILAIILHGDLDSVTTPAFQSQIQQHLDAGHSKIIVDCRYMGYISSLGMGSLVSLQTRLRRRGGQVKLSTIQGPVMEILRLVHLDKVFDMYGDLEFARQSFYPAPPTTPAS